MMVSYSKTHFVSAALMMVLGLNACSDVSSDAESAERQVVATFSIVGFDPKTSDLGIAVRSKFFKG